MNYSRGQNDELNYNTDPAGDLNCSFVGKNGCNYNYDSLIQLNLSMNLSFVILNNKIIYLNLTKKSQPFN